MLVGAVRIHPFRWAQLQTLQGLVLMKIESSLHDIRIESLLQKHDSTRKSYVLLRAHVVIVSIYMGYFTKEKTFSV